MLTELNAPASLDSAAGEKAHGSASEGGALADSIKDTWSGSSLHSSLRSPVQPQADKGSGSDAQATAQTTKSFLPEVMLVAANDAVPAAAAERAAAAPTLEHSFQRVNDALVGLFHVEHPNLRGEMTNAEIGRLTQRSGLTDDQAIMLAAVRANFDAVRALDPGHAGITNTAMRRLSELWQRHETHQGRPLTAAETALIDSMQSSTAAHRGYLEGANRSLFATPNARDSIVADACTQGIGIGNCHFVSAMTAMAQRDPAALERMITDNHNGTYTVNFPGQDPIRVNAPTNAELAYYGTGNSHGTWSTILQTAYGRLWSPNDTAHSGLEGAGGSMRSDGLRTLSGEGMTTTHTGRLTWWSTLHENLQLANRWPTTATVFQEVGEMFGGNPSTGFTGGHEYAVLGFVPNPNNMQAARVTIQNPHRYMSWPNGQVPAGMIDRGDGRVEMSLAQFNQIFYNFSSAVRPQRPEIPHLGP